MSDEKRPIKLALVQQTPTEDFEASVERGLVAVAEAAAEGANLVVFPELAFTPFFPQYRSDGNHLDRAEAVPGPTTEKFCAAAKEHGVVIVINLYELVDDGDGRRAYDSSPVIDSDGTLLGVSRMMHITQYEGFYEQDYYAPGDVGAPVFDTAVGKVGVSICYDRHYPEHIRMMALAGADLVVVPQAGCVGEWPDGLYEAELKVQAFHNGIFMALCNRVGVEDALHFCGGSFVVDGRGQLVDQGPFEEEAIVYSEIDLSELGDVSARQLFFKHRRPTEYGPLLAVSGNEGGQ